MGKQKAKVVRLWERRAREAAAESADIPHYKRTGGERPLLGLCCVECSDKSFGKLDAPRRGSCGHDVFQENVMLCTRCGLTCQSERLCRSCGKSVERLIREDKEIERREEKARRLEAKRPLSKGSR